MKSRLHEDAHWTSNGLLMPIEYTFFSFLLSPPFSGKSSIEWNIGYLSLEKTSSSWYASRTSLTVFHDWQVFISDRNFQGDLSKLFSSVKCLFQLSMHPRTLHQINANKTHVAENHIGVETIYKVWSKIGIQWLTLSITVLTITLSA